MNPKIGYPKRIKIKIFTQAPTVDLSSIVPIFHQWIRERSVPGLLIDVANYAHVPNGPGVMLIGHEADYAIDLANGKSGLLYDRKRDTGDNLQTSLAIFLQSAFTAVDLLEQNQTAAPSLLFDRNLIEISFADRLHTPNTPEIFKTVYGDIEAALKVLFPNIIFAITRIENDRRRPLTAGITLGETQAIGSSVNTAALA